MADTRIRDTRLPTAPDARERVLYAKATNHLLIVSQLIGWCGLTLALLLFSLNSVWLAPFTAWVVLGAAYFGLSFIANTSFRGFDIDEHDRLVANHRYDRAPSVDVLLPNCGEEIEVLENAFAHVARLEYDGELNVICLDDAGRSEVADSAGRHGFTYLSRPDKEAGNLRHGYLRSSGDFLVVFDADFCPRPDFLTELLPYAQSDPQVGIVQSPQYFEVRDDKGWLENGAGAVQEFFYRWVMPARDRRRSPICVGTNAIYRRAALEQTDGGAMVHSSEDVHTGFDLMCKGWRTKYVPVVLAKGLCPSTLQAFFNQQHRWCSGSMSLLFSRKFWSERIGLRARLTFLSGMTYFVYTALAVIVAPLPTVLMVCFFPDKVKWWNYALLVPALLQSFVFLPLWHRAPYGLDVMRTKLVYAWAHLFAFADRLRGRSLAWSPTGGPNGGSSSRLRTVKLLLVGWPLACLGGVIVGSALHMGSVLDLNFWPPILSAGLYATVSALVLRPLGETRYVPAPAAALDSAASQQPVVGLPALASATPAEGGGR